MQSKCVRFCIILFYSSNSRIIVTLELTDRLKRLSKIKIEFPAVGAVMATDIWSSAFKESKLSGVIVTVADTTPRSANTSIARSSTSSAVAPLRVPTRQASKQQIEMDSRRNNPAVISSVPIIKIRINGKQNAASTAATPERAVPERNLERRRGEAPVGRSDWWVVFC